MCYDSTNSQLFLIREILEHFLKIQLLKVILLVVIYDFIEKYSLLLDYFNEKDVHSSCEVKLVIMFQGDTDQVISNK